MKKKRQDIKSGYAFIYLFLDTIKFQYTMSTSWWLLIIITLRH